jgi:DNA-3-methyladenine glycosylase I
MSEPPRRCPWCGQDPLYVDYHDREWGVPSHDEGHLFEMLCLEGAQAGLSWITVLRKREGYRRAFEGFDPERLAALDDEGIARLLADPSIVRNRRKVESARSNARALLTFRERGLSLDGLLWGFVDGIPRHNAWVRMEQIPASTPESDRMSRELKRLGFSFVGTAICYALMQSVGMVNDHLVDCHRHGELANG